MTLTEEQRAAIKIAIRYIPNWPSACKENCAVDVLRAMIDSSGTVEPTGGFDLEKARAMICHYRIENPGDADTDCGLGDLVRQANLAEEALDEIERLRVSLVEHEEHENQTHAILGAILGTDDTLENVAKRAMTRIAEREKWLKEERAGAIRTESYDHCEGMYTIDLPDAMIRAQQELQSEGKIGPGTVAPPCWLLRGDFQSREELSEEQAEVDAIAEKGA